MKVASNAPAMPRTVVRMNPLGLFGQGDRNRAMTPATKPTRIIQRMPLMTKVLPQNNRDVEASARSVGLGDGSAVGNSIKAFAIVRFRSAHARRVSGGSQRWADA